MNTEQVAKTPDGYLVVDARSAPRETARDAPASTARSERELRSMLERFGCTQKAIDEAVQEVNRVGQASIPVGG
jgi:hypothetical protein